MLRIIVCVFRMSRSKGTVLNFAFAQDDHRVDFHPSPLFSFALNEINRREEREVKLISKQPKLTSETWEKQQRKTMIDATRTRRARILDEKRTSGSEVKGKVLLSSSVFPSPIRLERKQHNRSPHAHVLNKTTQKQLRETNKTNPLSLLPRPSPSPSPPLPHQKLDRLSLHYPVHLPVRKSSRSIHVRR